MWTSLRRGTSRGTLIAPVQSTVRCLNNSCCFTVPAGGEYYVVFYVGNTRRAATRVVNAHLNAHKITWEEKFEVYVADNVVDLKFQLKVSFSSHDEA